MRPNLDDYEDVNVTSDYDAPRSRAMSWLVLGVAVLGFGALAYVAYQSGTQSINEAETLVVEAETTPIKEAPINPEGEQFANKDKTIYDVISPTDADKKVEQLLPETSASSAIATMESPQADLPSTATPPASPTTKLSTTTTFVNPKANAKEEAPLAKEATAATVTTPKPVTKDSITSIEKPADEPIKLVDAKQPPAAPIIKEAEEKPVAKAPSPTVVAPKMISEKTAIAAPVTAVTTRATTSATAGEKPATSESKKSEKPGASTASGPYKIQLGAYQSEEEARASWKKITTKFAGVVKGSPIIVEAELDNGTFYRLRASGYASAADAKAACAKLAAKSQPCFPVGK